MHPRPCCLLRLPNVPLPGLPVNRFGAEQRAQQADSWSVGNPRQWCTPAELHPTPERDAEGAMMWAQVASCWRGWSVAELVLVLLGERVAQPVAR